MLNEVDRAWSIMYEYAATGQWDKRWDDEFEPLVRKLHEVDSLRRIPLQQYALDDPELSPIPPLYSRFLGPDEQVGRGACWANNRRRFASCWIVAYRCFSSQTHQRARLPAFLQRGNTDI